MKRARSKPLRCLSKRQLRNIVAQDLESHSFLQRHCSERSESENSLSDYELRERASSNSFCDENVWMDINDASFSSTYTLGTEQAENVDLGTEVNDGNGPQDLQSFLRNWATDYGVTQPQLKPLLIKLKAHECFRDAIPKDPRILLDIDFKKTVLRSLAGLKLQANARKEQLDNVQQTLEELKELINRLPIGLTASRGADKLYNFKAIFPIKTVAELQAVEDSLTQDDYKTDLVRFFDGLGGRSTKEATFIIMNKVLSNKLASSFSWLGNKGKHVFSGLRLCNIILESLVRNKNVSSQSSAIEKIKDWLRHAPERFKREQTKDVGLRNVRQFDLFDDIHQNEEVIKAELEAMTG